MAAGSALQLTGLLIVLATLWRGRPDLTAPDLAPGTFACGIGQGLALTTVVRLVLSQVPADRAGAGSGAFTTAQQTSPALAGSTGPRNGFLVVVGVDALMTVGIIGLSRLLPDPRAT